MRVKVGGKKVRALRSKSRTCRGRKKRKLKRLRLLPSKSQRVDEEHVVSCIRSDLVHQNDHQQLDAENPSQLLSATDQAAFADTDSNGSCNAFGSESEDDNWTWTPSLEEDGDRPVSDYPSISSDSSSTDGDDQLQDKGITNNTHATCTEGTHTMHMHKRYYRDATGCISNSKAAWISS